MALKSIVKHSLSREREMVKSWKGRVLAVVKSTIISRLKTLLSTNFSTRGYSLETWLPALFTSFLFQNSDLFLSVFWIFKLWGNHHIECLAGRWKQEVYFCVVLKDVCACGEKGRPLSHKANGVAFEQFSLAIKKYLYCGCHASRPWRATFPIMCLCYSLIGIQRGGGDYWTKSNGCYKYLCIISLCAFVE